MLKICALICRDLPCPPKILRVCKQNGKMIQASISINLCTELGKTLFFPVNIVKHEIHILELKLNYLMTDFLSSWICGIKNQKSVYLYFLSWFYYSTLCSFKVIYKSEVATADVLYKKVLLKTLQNFQENTCARSLF